MRGLRPDWTAAPANHRAHTWEEFKKDSEKCRKVVQKPHEQRAVTCFSIFKALLSSTVNRQNNRMTTHFRSGPAFGLSAEVKSKLAGKYDPQKEEELRMWIQDVTGKRMGDNFMESLKDGVLLCELINVLQPGSVKKINHSSQNWHQLENIGNFVRAITEYGLKPHDIFEANDLFENVNHTQVQCTLIALAGM
ncbi:calponin-1, partial [Lates japonicus]